MKILHIARIGTNLDNGVNVVVPMHVAEQSKFSTTALVNLNNVQIAGVCQLPYNGKDDFPYSQLKVFGRPDLIIFHEVNNFEYIALYKKLIKEKIPYIIIPHGEISKEALKKKWLKKKIAYFLFFNKFIKNALAVQNLSKGEYDKTFIAKNKFISPNGIAIPAECKSVRQGEGMRLLYIGRLDWVHKGLDRMINALGVIRDFALKNHITLDIYGPDVMGRKAVIQEFTQKNELSDIVKIYDPVFGDAKREEIFNHDVFIQTSRFEGQPLSVLEAMAYGMPCILTQGTNLIEEALSQECAYAAGETPEEIGETIKKAFYDRCSWEEKGAKARKYITENYSWDKVAETTVAEYKKIICENESV